jgi:UDP-N-acetylmuramate--alanine ligase
MLLEIWIKEHSIDCMATPLYDASVLTPAALRGKHLHFMGVGGSGITTAAQLALLAGARCSGCDQTFSSTTTWMAEKGVSIVQDHSPEHVTDIDLLIISPAITKLDPHNPEVVAAQERGIPVILWQALLGAFMVGKFGVSIAGVHGKGTTTSMVSHILIEAGTDPTCEVGAIVPAWQGNVRIGEGRYFVNEADEFNHNFMHYHPRLALINNIEYEHADYFKDFAAMRATFIDFIHGMDMSDAWELPPTIVLNGENEGCRMMRDELGEWPGQIVTFAIDAQSDYQGSDVRLTGETSFAVRDPQGNDLGRFELLLPGRYNVENALAAVAMTHQLGIAPDVIRQALATYSGIYRRFQVRSCANDILIIDDYAHHPTAVSAMLTATRIRYPDRRIVAVFQPNMYTRLKAFFDGFASSFGVADEVIIPYIFPAREYDTGLVHGRDLVAAIQRQPQFVGREDCVRYGGSLEETAEFLKGFIKPGDVVPIMGSGNVYRVTGMLLSDPEFIGYVQGLDTH